MHPIDTIILILYAAAILAGGLWYGRREKSSEDFIVGGRRIHWIPVLLSIMATEISAMTFLAVPHTGFEGNYNYLQWGLGSILARFAVAFLFLTVFYRQKVLTVYQYLAQRFGNRTRYTASLFFIIFKLSGGAVRLVVAIHGIALLTPLGFDQALFVFMLLAVFYTSVGGIKAIIWTDCVQAIVFLGGGVAVALFFVFQLGWDNILTTTAQAEINKFEIFRWTPDAAAGGGWKAWFGDANLFFLAILFGFISTAGAMGCDQDMTQRMLTCRRVEEARRSLILSGLFGIPVAALFLFIGTCLFVFYGGEAPGDARMVFAQFILEELPAGLRGLLFAGAIAAAMSSVDSALGALSSTAAQDLYRPLLRTPPTEKRLVLVSRIGVLAFGLILWGLTWILRGIEDQMLFVGFKIASVPMGALMGIFLLGLLTRTRGNERGNLIAFFSGTALAACTLILVENNLIGLGWTWVLPLHILFTFGIAALYRKNAG